MNKACNFITQHKDELELKYVLDEFVYYVLKKRKNIFIKTLKIESIEFSTDDIEYKASNLDKTETYSFHNRHNNVFKTVKEAYKYAEELVRRKNIKLITYTGTLL